MNKFEDILNSTQWIRSLNKPIGLSSQIVEMLNKQEQISKSFSSLTDITRMINNQMVISNPSITAIENIVKSIRLDIPNTAIDTMISITRRHTAVFDSMRAITDSLKIQSPILSQINSLNLALSEISTRVANIAKTQGNWTLLDEFEEITESGFDFSESLSGPIDEERDKQFDILLKTILAFLDKNKALGLSALLVVDIFLRFAGFHQYYDFLKEKPEPITKTELKKVDVKQDTVLNYLRLINQELKRVDEYSLTNRSCLVKIKPKLTSFTITKLPPNFEVIVLQVHHKWVYVSYFDTLDNLPNTGWILKKYLDRH